MLNKGFLGCVLVFLTVANMAVIALCVLHAITVWKIVHLSDKKAELTDQMTLDWSIKPFT